MSLAQLSGNGKQLLSDASLWGTHKILRGTYSQVEGRCQLPNDAVSQMERSNDRKHILNMHTVVFDVKTAVVILHHQSVITLINTFLFFLCGSKARTCIAINPRRPDAGNDRECSLQSVPSRIYAHVAQFPIPWLTIFSVCSQKNFFSIVSWVHGLPYHAPIDVQCSTCRMRILSASNTNFCS